jgi:hypothetical protein
MRCTATSLLMTPRAPLARYVTERVFVLYTSKVQQFRTLECASVGLNVCGVVSVLAAFSLVPGLVSFAQVDTWLGPEADPDLYKTRQQPQNYMQQNLQYVRQMQASLASQVSVSSRASSKPHT